MHEWFYHAAQEAQGFTAWLVRIITKKNELQRTVKRLCGSFA
jgi:hypothetical protein